MVFQSKEFQVVCPGDEAGVWWIRSGGNTIRVVESLLSVGERTDDVLFGDQS